MVMGSFITKLWIYENHIWERTAGCGVKSYMNYMMRWFSLWFSYIHNVIIILSRVYNEPIQRPVPTWLVSWIVRALHRYRRTGSRVRIPYKPNFFFPGFFFTTPKVASPTAMIFFLIIKIIIFISILIRSIYPRSMLRSVVIYRLNVFFATFWARTSTFKGEVLFTVEYVGLRGANAIDKSSM